MGKPLKNPEAPFWLAMNTYEKGLIERALEAAGGSVAKTAARLGVSRQFLSQRCQARGIKTAFGHSEERKQKAAAARHGKREAEAAAATSEPTPELATGDAAE